MSKVLVLYYSSYGHLETMAHAIAEGARAAGAEVDVKRVPETVPEDVARGAHFKLDQAAPIATVAELEHYDAIILGTGTRFGRISSQMAAFLDQAGGLWARGALNGKVGGAFTSTATQHGGQETTLTSFHTTLFHHGMVVVGLPYSFEGMTRMDEITGGTPYGATALAGAEVVFGGPRHLALVGAGPVNSGLFQAMAKTLDGDLTGLKFASQYRAASFLDLN